MDDVREQAVTDVADALALASARRDEAQGEDFNPLTDPLPESEFQRVERVFSAGAREVAMGWSSKAWSPFHAAKQKGREAALASLPRDTCPYWSRAFQLAWLEGYDQALAERQAAHPTDRSESDE